jgi:DNA-binding CsgD family transcriptional regulator
MLVDSKLKLDDSLSSDILLAESGYVLTTFEIAWRLGISEESARALVKATSQKLGIPRQDLVIYAHS